MSFAPYPGGGGQGWEQFGGRIEARFGQRMKRPVWLWPVATASLPTTSELGANEGALTYDDTLNAPTFYDGSAWKAVGVVGGGTALTSTDDTNVTITLGGAPTTALLSATSLTVGWSGTLAVARGGTGAANAGDARTNLGLGTLATQNASAAAFTGNTTAENFQATQAISTSGWTAFAAGNRVHMYFNAGAGNLHAYNDSTATHLPLVLQGSSLTVSLSGTEIVVTTSTGFEPATDNTFYLGRNDDDSPKAWKGLILADQSNGKKYRIEMVAGVLTATDLTD